MKVFDQGPALSYIEDDSGVLELHAGDGIGASKPEVIRRCLQYLEKHRVEVCRWPGRECLIRLLYGRVFRDAMVLTILIARCVDNGLGRGDMSNTLRALLSSTRRRHLKRQVVE